MTQGARIDLRAGGERIVWTTAGFRGFTPRGRRLAANLAQLVRPEDRPAEEPSLTRWVEARLRELGDLELELVRVGPTEGDIPQGARA